MKSKINLLSFLIAIFALALSSCNKDEQLPIKKIDSSTKALPESDVNHHIVYVSWDEWERKKKNCDGWGLCNFRGCLFCCTNSSGIIVDCDTGEPVSSNAGTIIIDKKTNIGYMAIELNNNIDIQKNAITNKDPFYIDEDITVDNITLHKGIYIFDEKVGEYGGYLIEASMR